MVEIPNSGLVSVLTGAAKFGWLKILKNSPRNCSLNRSVSANWRRTARSDCQAPKPRRKLRGASPSWPAGGARNAAALIRRAARDVGIAQAEGNAGHGVG